MHGKVRRPRGHRCKSERLRGRGTTRIKINKKEVLLGVHAIVKKKCRVSRESRGHSQNIARLDAETVSQFSFTVGISVVAKSRASGAAHAGLERRDAVEKYKQ